MTTVTQTMTVAARPQTPPLAPPTPKEDPIAIKQQILSKKTCQAAAAGMVQIVNTHKIAISSDQYCFSRSLVQWLNRANAFAKDASVIKELSSPAADLSPERTNEVLDMIDDAKDFLRCKASKQLVKDPVTDPAAQKKPQLLLERQAVIDYYAKRQVMFEECRIAKKATDLITVVDVVPDEFPTLALARDLRGWLDTHFLEEVDEKKTPLPSALSYYTTNLRETWEELKDDKVDESHEQNERSFVRMDRFDKKTKEAKGAFRDEQKAANRASVLHCAQSLQTLQKSFDERIKQVEESAASAEEKAKRMTALQQEQLKATQSLEIQLNQELLARGANEEQLRIAGAALNDVKIALQKETKKREATETSFAQTSQSLQNALAAANTRAYDAEIRASSLDATVSNQANSIREQERRIENLSNRDDGWSCSIQ